MQLLRDNLTLWTSSDGGDGEAAPAEGAKEGEKPAEAEAAPAEAAEPHKTEEAAPAATTS